MENNNNPTILNLNLGSYVEEIQKMRQALARLKTDSNEYIQLLAQIKEKQEGLTDTLKQQNEATDSTKTEMAQARLEVNNYAQTIDGLKQHIQDLKTASSSMDMNSDEYKKATAEIKNLQDTLKDLKGDTAQARIEADQYANSLNGMRAKLSDMKAAMANMDVGGEAFKKMAADANELNDKIKDAEQSYGVFSRSVGDYSNSFKAAFTDMGFSLDNILNKTKEISNGVNGFASNFSTAFNNATKNGKTLTTVLKGVTSGLWSAVKGAIGLEVALGPVLLVVTAISLAVAALVGAFQAVKMAIESDEQSAREWDEAMADMEYYWDTIKNLCLDLGKALLDVIIPAVKLWSEFIVKVVNNFKLALAYASELFGNKAYAEKLRNEVALSEETRERYREAIAKQHELDDLKRKNLVENKKLEKEINDLKEKAFDKEKYNAQQRQKFLNDAEAKEKEILENKRKELELERRVLEINQSKSDNNKADNDAMAKLNADIADIDAQISKVSATYTKQRQRIISEQQAQLKAEMQAQANYYKLMSDNLNKYSKEWKKAKQEELKLNREIAIKDIEMSKYSDDIKNKLIEETQKKFDKLEISLQIELNTSEFEEKYNNFIKQIENLPDKTDNVYKEWLNKLNEFKQNYINSLNDISKVNPSFIPTIEDALKDMAQNYIPITMENLKKYLLTMNKAISADEEKFIKDIEKYYNTSFDEILITLNNFRVETETIANNKDLSKLTSEFKRLEQGVRILDSTYRQFMHNFETKYFAEDVVEDFKAGRFSLQGYITELTRFIKVNNAQVISLETEKKRLEELASIKKQELATNRQILQEKLKEKEANENDVVSIQAYQKALENVTKAEEKLLDINNQVSHYKKAIDEIINISNDLYVNFDENIPEKLENYFGKGASEDWQHLSATISMYIREISSQFSDGIINEEDFSNKLNDLRYIIKNGLQEIVGTKIADIPENRVDDIMQLFVPTPEKFKENASKAFNEMEKITSDQFKQEMKWYDEHNKEILQKRGEIQMAYKELEMARDVIIRDETVEDRQKRIYEATVKYEQAILNWEKTFFDERRKQQEEAHNMRQTGEDEYSYMFQSKKQIKNAFKEEKEALDEVYNERNTYLVGKLKDSEQLQKDIKKDIKKATSDEEKESLQAELDNELAIYAQYNQEKLALDTSYNDAKQEIESNYEELRKQFKLENDPIEVLKQEIESEKEILDEWFNEKLQLYADNEEKLLELKKEYAEKRTAIARKEAKQEDMTYKRNLNTTQKLADGTGKIICQIAQYYEEDLEQKQRNGDITEEEAKKQFEVMKGWQIAAAVVDTLRGGLGIYMGTMADSTIQPSWLRFAMAGLGYATTLASGFLTIKQIESTRFGDGSGSAGGAANIAATAVSYNPVTVKPLLDEQADMGSYTNVSASPDYEDGQELRVTILESDIQESNARVAMRQSRTSF